MGKSFSVNGKLPQERKIFPSPIFVIKTGSGKSFGCTFPTKKFKDKKFGAQNFRNIILEEKNINNALLQNDAQTKK